MAGQLSSDPVIWSKLLASNNVIPGDTIKKLQGIISGDYALTHNGISGSLITWSPNTSHSFKLNGRIDLNGAYNRYENVEFLFNGWSSRNSIYSGGNAADMPSTKYLNVNGENIELYRCVIHDLAGLGIWSTAKNMKLTECIIYYNGWQGTDRGHGHGIYNQNISGVQTLSKCIVFGNWGCGLHTYSESINIDGITCEDCVFFNNGQEDEFYEALIGSGSSDKKYTNVVFRRNEIYSNADKINVGLNIGYVGGSEGSVVQDNYVVSRTASQLNTTINTNLNCSGNSFFGYNNWQPNPELNIYGNRPTSGIRSRLILCDSSRAHLTIYNYDMSPTVDIDCSSLLSSGDSYRLTNVQDLYIDIVTGTAGSSGIITVPMTGRTIANPEAHAAPITSFPEFGCFILEKI